MFLRVINLTRQKTLASRVRIASSLKDRTIGLLGTSGLGLDEGLWLSPCRAIHMVGMRYPIDAIWVDPSGVVLYAGTIKPWRLSHYVARANGVLEVAQGRLQATDTQLGDRLQFVEVN